jgi:hypothetical protein
LGLGLRIFFPSFVDLDGERTRALLDLLPKDQKAKIALTCHKGNAAKQGSRSKKKEKRKKEKKKEKKSTLESRDKPEIVKKKIDVVK